MRSTGTAGGGEAARWLGLAPGLSVAGAMLCPSKGGRSWVLRRSVGRETRSHGGKAMLSRDFVPGGPNWVDLGTTDVDSAVTFYSAVFGWQFQSAGPEAGGYGMFTLDGKTVGAAGPLTEQAAAPSWTIYFHAPDANATAAAVKQAGGAVRAEPFDVFSAGRMAQFTDPTGALFAVWQPGETVGLEAVHHPGTLVWTAMHHADPAAAQAFFHA